jgi:hypothetical protein
MDFDHRGWTTMRLLASSLLGVALLTQAAKIAHADEAAPVRELATATDFRIRVSAALLIGNRRPAGALRALEQALDDSHPAVRVAAAEALGALRDPAATATLQDHLAADSSPSVKAQIRATLERLRDAQSGSPFVDLAASSPLRADVRCVVMLGTMRNTSGIRGEDLRQVLADAARARVQALHGVLLTEGDAVLLRQAAVKRIPIVVLDGRVSTLSESSADGNVQVRARVEFTVRRDQTLKGTVSGAATTFGSGPTLSEPGRRRLQDDAVSGAVQSALRGADEGFIVAAR